MARTVESVLEDAVAGDVIDAPHGAELSYAVAGTFEGIAILERSSDGGRSWAPTGVETEDEEISGAFVHELQGVREASIYRWRCTEFTSGSIETSITRASKTLFEQKSEAGKVLLRVTEDGVEMPLGALDLDVTVHGTGSIELVPSDEPWDEEGSHQTIAADLEILESAGSDDGTDPAFLAAIMGNLLGTDPAGEGNYLAGVIGALSCTQIQTDYPSGGILGIIMDGSTGADGAVVAVLDGSDPSAVTRARAMFACRVLNNNDGTGVDYGLDLYAEPSEHYSDTEEETPQGLNVAVAEIRLSNGLYIMSGEADPSAGDGVEAPSGSLYLRTNGEHWRKTGPLDTDWTENGDA